MRVRLTWLLLGLSCVLLLVSATTGVPGGQRMFGAYLDATLEATLPTWWSTALFTFAALLHGVVALVLRRTGAPGAGWWAASAALLAGLSLAEHTSVHERFGAESLTAQAGIAAVAVALLVPARIGGRAGWLIAAGGTLTVLPAVGGDLLGRAVRAAHGAASPAHILLVHAAELGENAGALLFLTAAAGVVTISRQAGALHVGLREPAGVAEPGRGRGWWVGCVAVTLLLSVASLVMVLNASALGPGARDLRRYLDVLIEDNLPTWWSSALLLAAAAAHALVALVWRAARVRGALCWAISAAVLIALALDDHTQLHERTEALGRLFVDAGDYPFLWLLPGAVAGAAVVAAMVLLAIRAPRRARTPLVLGVAVLLGCALGLELAQGFFIAAGQEGMPFAVTYHIEELGENVAALLLLGAAVRALRVAPAESGLALAAPGGVAVR